MADHNPRLHQAVMEVIENQLRANDPPETRQTLQRLMGEGHSRQEAMNLIGTVVAVEVFNVMKHGEMFNLERFVTGLKGLPALPYDEEE